MRALKVAFLLVLVLAAMRATSWLLQWVLSRLAGVPGRVAIVSGNLAALALFVGYLWWDRVPGEPMDRDAVLFGLVVFFPKARRRPSMRISTKDDFGPGLANADAHTNPQID